MNLPAKPGAAIVDGKLCIYVGGDYKMLPPDVAHDYVRKLQGLDARLQRQVRRAKREATKPPTQSDHGSSI